MRPRLEHLMWWKRGIGRKKADAFGLRFLPCSGKKKRRKTMFLSKKAFFEDQAKPLCCFWWVGLKFRKEGRFCCLMSATFIYYWCVFILSGCVRPSYKFSNSSRKCKILPRNHKTKLPLSTLHFNEIGWKREKMHGFWNYQFETVMHVFLSYICL